ncbi:MAG: DUF4857 domain-containing protein [Mangrovibacterium sp.]
MKQLKKYTYPALILCTTLVSLIFIPSLVKKATVEPNRYPFVYYSTIAEELCIVDYKNDTAAAIEVTGKVYRTQEEADSVLPILKYRQLMSDGLLPDSIKGKETSARTIRAENVIYLFKASAWQSPQPSLYIMYESMPVRVGLESPGDVFRLKDKIEFIDIKTNSIETEKSALFQAALEKHGFAFPAQWCNGNMTTRKPYDEGYFVLDAQNQLFHMKMVNGRPYVKNTGIGKDINIQWFDMQEAGNRRYYGFIYDTAGAMYIIGYEDGTYHYQKLDIAPLNLATDDIMIMGNLFYWTVSVSTETGKVYYGLEKDSLNRLSEHFIPKTKDNWDQISQILFPFYIRLESPYTYWVYPEFIYTSHYAWLTNLILALAFFFLAKKRTSCNKTICSIWILLAGIAGLVACLLIPAPSKIKPTGKFLSKA